MSVGPDEFRWTLRRREPGPDSVPAEPDDLHARGIRF